MKERISRWWEKLRQTVRTWLDIRDLHVYGGVGALSVAGWLVYEPLGYAVCGAMLFYLGAFWPDRHMGED